MVPDYTYILSYHPSLEPSDYFILGDDTKANIYVQGAAIVELN